MEKIDFSEDINKKIEIINDDILSGKINLLELELNPIFSDIKDSLSIFNIENYSQSYVNACELLNRKFEELRNLLNSLDIEKKFMDFLKENPEENEIVEIFNGCWNNYFELEALSLNFLEYAENRFCKERIMDFTIEHLNKESSDYQFLLEIPKLKFTEKVNAFFNKIRNKLPCYFEEVFEENIDQLKIYEQFVYLLHLLQLGKVKYQKETNTLYV
ncbi:MAG: hypothetical protein HWN79_09010 [Candidatus Lokiarchaeota archaeon]|nr:hypothetical protein [Candidatus Lokiarchaeota archaeon]